MIDAKVIEMNKTEAKAAGRYNSEEFKELSALRVAYPDFRIVIKTTKSKDNMKGLDTKFMEKYIKEHDETEDKAQLKEFYSLRGLDENGKKKQFAQAVPYGILKQWFLTYFPEVADMNNTIDEILKKAQAKREAAKKAA
jgi:hypothetical protein